MYYGMLECVSKFQGIEGAQTLPLAGKVVTKEAAMANKLFWLHLTSVTLSGFTSWSLGRFCKLASRDLERVRE